MRKTILLALGFIVAALAAWAVPREQTSLPKVKIEVSFIHFDVALQTEFIVDQPAPFVNLLQERWRVELISLNEAKKNIESIVRRLPKARSRLNGSTVDYDLRC